ncbi:MULTISPECIES: DEAD/DEAH box helicase [Streptacidiphilus]|uniref:DEAD/DEAH box helicase n=1 Tax=Streptacidiphilus cavernicola TaxID=3342716 RepID=A0ABV6UEB9_9ACTN|nr:SNF2-related protein [Streptacidiphilus jeojiense]
MGQGRDRRELYRLGERLHRSATEVVDEYRAAVERVRTLAEELRDRETQASLDEVPVDRLSDVTDGRLRVTALEAAGFRTVGQVHRAEAYELLRAPGIGRQSADQAKVAAAQLARAAREATAVRIDPDRRDPAGTGLVTELFPFVQAGPGLLGAQRSAEQASARLAVALADGAPARSALRLRLLGRARREAALAAVAAVAEVLTGAEQGRADEVFAQAAVDLLRRPSSPDQAWLEFETRAAEFYTVLGQLAEEALRRVPAESSEGHLPDRLARAVRGLELDESLLRVSLRGYQVFGARYALVQRRTILGDEMGLGKTIQAIAAMAHLAAGGERHFLVVCPASVLVNWLREIESRSRLTAHRVHGTHRGTALLEWRHEGGVAVTTFEGLRYLDGLPAGAAPATAMVVVDEAHYVKNPQTLRARKVRALTDGCERVLFLTGTVMENRVEEFRALLSYLQPGLLPPYRPWEPPLGAEAFRHAVAPAYLRRNQSDVLSELPLLVHSDEWQEFSAADEDAYRQAVAAANFPAMRRAAYAVPEQSAKLRRLGEIVAEAVAAGEKVLVFSYFRDVLTAAQKMFGERVPVLLGPLSGRTEPGERQQVVDRFGAAPGPAVLLAQIQVGGIGLNLQAASVVVLCEPQVKPALEQQAVARAHRMGQTRRVRVHRLLTPDSVDQRLLRLLARKQDLFDAYARRSDAAEASPEALDISEPSLARQIIEAEQQRLAEQAPSGR